MQTFQITFLATRKLDSLKTVTQRRNGGTEPEPINFPKWNGSQIPLLTKICHFTHLKNPFFRGHYEF